MTKVGPEFASDFGDLLSGPIAVTTTSTGTTTTEGSGLVPYLIEAGETYTVPIKKQGLFSMNITVESGGILDVDGYLIEVH